MVRSAVGSAFGWAVWFLAGTVQAAPQTARGSAVQMTSVVTPVIAEYCAGCHDAEVKKGGLDLQRLSQENVTQHPDEWERVIRKLRARQMPPPGKRRPGESAYQLVVDQLSSTLDREAARHPHPGRTETLRRLNRTEYGNAIRDLLGLEIDAAALLPKDDASHGFDNVTVGDLSPTLLDRYISAAQKIGRLAVGRAGQGMEAEIIRIRPDLTQEEHVEGLPLGTRGGALISHTFPQDGEYEIQVRLTRDRNEEIEGLHEPHELEVLIDRSPVQRFTVTPPAGHKDYEAVDAKLKVRLPVTAGPHQVGVTFLKNPSTLLETKRQPYQAHFNMHRHPRLTPAVYQISIQGPDHATGPGETPSRRRIFVSRPAKPGEEVPCAERILRTLMRRAYRRPVTEADLQEPMTFYRQAATEGGFEAGIEEALAAILVNPHFLFRVETDPVGVARRTAYRISDLALASRLSFFLWSSIPDDELLEVAARGELHQSRVLERQTRRMLADGRARSLAVTFAGQWLYLRNLDSFTPDLRLFPDFDDNLRQSFRRETELFFEAVLRADRSVLDLLHADFTFLNERLAKHYGIPHVYGSRFRRVALDRESQRGGLLRQGSILTVTSYATRTSPVIRGSWVLGNLLGTPPPPPPADVPALKENSVSAILPMRERLAEHRANAACASCHNLMDPVGFALENFDAVGRWRTVEEGRPIEVAGGLPDGSTFEGVAGLEEGLRKRPDLFVGALTEKLMTFALGRGIELSDGPAVRQIVREARVKEFAFSSLILGIVHSSPFTMRNSL